MPRPELQPRFQRVEQDGIILWLDPQLRPGEGAQAVMVRLRRFLFLFPYLDLLAA